MIGTGPQIYGDRDFTITHLPKNADGCEILMTACDAKGTTGDTAVFTAGDDIDLMIALDNRVETVPEWLSGYEKLPADTYITSSNDVTYDIYMLKVKKGEKVTLGSNGQTYMCVNFFALAVPSAWYSKPVSGDINGSGIVDTGDLVLLQKYLLRTGTLTSDQAESADLDGDGIIDVFDNVLLRKKLLLQK